MINGERTLPALIDMSPYGEFVTCRSLYRLIVNNLIEVAGKAEVAEEETEDEEEAVLSIVFYLYNNCFHRIRGVVDDVVGEDNTRFASFVSQYRSGLMTFFPGVDPQSDLMPSYDKFLAAVRAIPQPIRLQRLLSGLEAMLSEQLEYIYQLLGSGSYRDALNRVKREISEPLAKRRELVKRFGLEDGFYKTLKRSEKVVKMVRG
jgi:hypothetical protein